MTAREALAELVAGKYGSDEFEAFLRVPLATMSAARAALAREPARAVPREPTQEMIDAGQRAWRECSRRAFPSLPTVVWQAMYDAARGMKP